MADWVFTGEISNHRNQKELRCHSFEVQDEEKSGRMAQGVSQVQFNVPLDMVNDFAVGDQVEIVVRRLG